MRRHSSLEGSACISNQLDAYLIGEQIILFLCFALHISIFVDSMSGSLLWIRNARLPVRLCIPTI